MATPGSYVLISRLDGETPLSVGRLGLFRFAAGFYCYSGSARGPGGLEARLARHLRRRKRHHWHIDCLLGHTAVLEVWKAPSPSELECLFVQALQGLPGARIPVPGFGSSDCACRTHLVYFASLPSFQTFSTTIDALVAHPVRCERLLHTSLKAWPQR